MAEPVAPPGGFKQGGWYEGRQYWNGSFSAPGVIHSQSDQVGAGKPVSREVIAQTNPNNVAYIAEQQQQFFSSPGALQDMLDGAQNMAFSSGVGVQSTGEILADLRNNGLLPTGEAPKAPSMVDTFNKLAGEKGVDRLQADINALKAEEDELFAQTRINVKAEKGKPVAQNVIEGRVTEQKTEAQEKLDFIQRQKTRKLDELNSALGNIKMIMDFTQQDFANASAAYNTKFDQAIATINLVRGIQNDQKTDAQRAMDNARANAQILINNIKDGGLDIRNLAPEQRAQLSKLEVQSGLPVGFFSNLRADPKANIISTSTENGVTQVLMRNPDGSISVQKYGTATGGSGGSKENQSLMVKSGIASDAASGKSLSQIFGAYTGLLPANDIYAIYNANSSHGSDKNKAAAPGSGYLSNYGVTLYK